MDERTILYHVDYKTRAGWRPYFIAESIEAAKAYLNEFQKKPLKWYNLAGYTMARVRREDGTYMSLRIVQNHLVTMKEVEGVRTRRSARMGEG
jgi:hypothetical protein